MRIRTKIVFVCFMFLIISFLTAKEAPETVGKNRLFILDGSGSMWGQIEKRSKIEIAKEVMKSLVGNLSEKDQVGLMVYGHRRKGDCDDVELVYPLAAIDLSALNQRIDTIQPKGKTPITQSVVEAIDLVRKLEDEADIILVSDGLETCKRDPCEAVKKARQAGVNFRLHVVGFDLKKEETAQLKCMADAGGGRYVLANNADELSDGMQEVVKHVPEPEDIGKASVSGPDKVGIGEYFNVEWEGPDAKSDFIAMRKADKESRYYLTYAYSNKGSPSKFRAPSDPGEYILYYVHGRSRQVLAEAPIKVVDAAASLDAPESVAAGSNAEIKWTGPDGKGDYITVTEHDAKPNKYNHYRYTVKGSPVKLAMPIDPGDYELRYVTGQKARVLARRPIKVTEITASLDVPETAVAGSPFEVVWTGPDNKSDYITIAEVDAPPQKYGSYAYTKKGSPAKLRAADVPGQYEVRYITAQKKRVLTSKAIEITTVTATLNVPTEAMAGSQIQIAWEGPDYSGDYITIVPEGEAVNKYGKYFPTRKAKNPSGLQLPEEPGTYEIRYLTGQVKSILTKAPIELKPAVATLTVAEIIKLGQPVEVSWTGPAGKNDKMILVDLDRPDSRPIESKSARSQKTLFFRSPKKAGTYELRYITGQWKRILAQSKVILE